jgi:hypothetical protein
MKWHSPRTLAIVACLLTAPLLAGDWPQFRYDAGRTAASPHELPAELQLRWTRTLPAPRPAFPQEVRLGYDASYEPVVLGRTMFVPSTVNDSVTALDTETGAERWRFITGGPVRFAPVAWEGKVYFVSDDGYLYCLHEDGSLRWKFRGLPEGPARSLGARKWAVGLVVAGARRPGVGRRRGLLCRRALAHRGRVRPRVDADSGSVVWSNTDSHHIPESNWDHGIGFDAGLTPQGYLAIVGDRLVVPCGTQLPAFLDVKTGALQAYTMGWGGRLGLPKGCWFVAGVGKYLSHAGDLYDITRPSDERLATLKPGERDYKSHAVSGRVDQVGHRTRQPTRTRPLSPAGDDARSDVRERQSHCGPRFDGVYDPRKNQGQHSGAPPRTRFRTVSAASFVSFGNCRPRRPCISRRATGCTSAGRASWKPSTRRAQNRKSCGERRSRARRSGCWQPTTSCSS